jgi:hypothetical protein
VVTMFLGKCSNGHFFGYKYDLPSCCPHMVDISKGKECNGVVSKVDDRKKVKK